MHFHEEKKAPVVAGRMLKPGESDGGIKLRCTSQTFTSPWLQNLSQVLLLFPISGVNSSASVQQLCEEDNTQTEKSVQYCFIFMPYPERKISSIHCNTFVILVGKNSRLRENADTSCQRKLFTVVPPFLSLGIFIIIFSASQRDEQNSCMDYKADS